MDLNLTSNFTNILISEPQPSASWSARALVPVVFETLCFLVGLPGNLAVIILKPNWSQLSNVTQCLMINLAISDLLCLVTLPVWIYNTLHGWTLGEVACKILAFVENCSIISSLLTITILSVQRYMQVVHQQRCLQFKKSLLILIWIISAALSIPPLVVRQTIKDQQQKTICRLVFDSPSQQVAVLLTECFVVLSSFTITCCAYIFLNKKLNMATFFNNAFTSKLLTSIIVTFFALWMPYIVFNLVVVGSILTNNVQIIEFYNLGFKIFASVAFINSSVNPLLYAFALGTCSRKRTARTFENNEEPSTANASV